MPRTGSSRHFAHLGCDLGGRLGGRGKTRDIRRRVACRHRTNTPMNVQHDCVCVNRKFGLVAGQSALQRLSRESNGTYIEDAKDPVELQLPTLDRLSIVLRVEVSRDSASMVRLMMSPQILVAALRLKIR